MDREKAKEIMKLYGKPKIKKNNTVISFTRQKQKDVEEIEKMKTLDLKRGWKELVWMNHIYGQVSLNELQRISLIELEMESRKINPKPLRDWYKRELKKYNNNIT
jgi:hypothetical protein